MGTEAIEGLRFLAFLPLYRTGRTEGGEKMQPFNRFHSRLFTTSICFFADDRTVSVCLIPSRFGSENVCCRLHNFLLRRARPSPIPPSPQHYSRASSCPRGSVSRGSCRGRAPPAERETNHMNMRSGRPSTLYIGYTVPTAHLSHGNKAMLLYPKTTSLDDE